MVHKKTVTGAGTPPPVFRNVRIMKPKLITNQVRTRQELIQAMQSGDSEQTLRATLKYILTPPNCRPGNDQQNNGPNNGPGNGEGGLGGGADGGPRAGGTAVEGTGGGGGGGGGKPNPPWSPTDGGEGGGGIIIVRYPFTG